MDGDKQRYDLSLAEEIKQASAAPPQAQRKQMPSQQYDNPFAQEISLSAMPTGAGQNSVQTPSAAEQMPMQQQSSATPQNNPFLLQEDEPQTQMQGMSSQNASPAMYASPFDQPQASAAQPQSFSSYPESNPSPEQQYSQQQAQSMPEMQSFAQRPAPVQEDPIAQFQRQNQESSLSEDKIRTLIDETVEKVIEEKWEKLAQNIEKVIDWKDEQEEELESLKKDLAIIGENFAKLEKKLSTRIEGYDKNILDVNSEIKALEKVFQKITPTLINNVNELSKIAKDFRSSIPKKKDSEEKDEEEK